MNKLVVLLLALVKAQQQQCTQFFGQCQFPRVCFNGSCQGIEQAFVKSLNPLVITLIVIGVLLLSCLCCCFRPIYKCLKCCGCSKRKPKHQSVGELSRAPYRIGAMTPTTTTTANNQMIEDVEIRDSNTANMFKNQPRWNTEYPRLSVQEYSKSIQNDYEYHPRHLSVNLSTNHLEIDHKHSSAPIDYNNYQQYEVKQGSENQGQYEVKQGFENEYVNYDQSFQTFEQQPLQPQYEQDYTRAPYPPYDRYQ